MEKEKAEKSVGFVFFVQKLRDTPLERVQRALDGSELPAAALRELHPRHLFARATRELVRSGIFRTGEEWLGLLRDKAPETKEQAIYQVSARKPAVGREGIEYVQRAYAVLDKETLTIRVDPPALQGDIEAAYAKVSGIYSPSDFRSLIHRIVKAKHKEIYLRDGVYFAPPGAVALIEGLRRFFADLGFSFYLLPVGISETGTQKDILGAVIEDVRKNVAALRAELDAAEDVSSEVARNRLETVRGDLLKYREIALGLGRTLAEVLERAGEAGKTLRQIGANSLDALIREVQTGVASDPLLVKIVGVRSVEDFRCAPDPRDEELRLELRDAGRELLFADLPEEAAVEAGLGG